MRGIWLKFCERFNGINIVFFLLGYGLKSQIGYLSSKQREIRIFNSALQFCPGGTGQFEANLLQQLNKLKPGLVLDVGAYDGRDAISYAKAGHKVLSFEPVPSKHSKIEENIKRSGFSSNIKLYKIALSNYSGTATFFTNKPLRKKDEWIDGNFGSEQDGFWVPWEGAEEISVPVDTLDNIIGMQKVLHIKIDAQGHDAVILEGAKRLLSNRMISTFSFEVAPKLTHDPDSYIRLIKWLSEHDYQCYDCSSFGVLGLDEIHMHLPVQDYFQKLSKFEWIHRGSDHGKHTEFVCLYTGS